MKAWSPKHWTSREAPHKPLVSWFWRLGVQDEGVRTLISRPHVISKTSSSLGLPGGSVVKNPLASAGDVSLIAGLGRFPGEGNDKPTPVFLLGKSHEQRRLAGYSPRGYKELYMI